MNKQIFFAGTSLTCALSALAAPAAAEYEFYFGGNLGAAFEDVDIEFNNDFGGSTSRQSETMALLGIHGGVNYDVGAYFFGFEADVAFPLDDDIGFGADCEEGEFCSLDYKAHFRARVGIDHNDWRFFVAGGFVVAEIEGNNGYSGSLNGYTIGGGVEYQPESSPWSARLEVLYDRFDDDNRALSGIYNPRTNSQLDEFIIRGGITYTFNLNGN